MLPGTMDAAARSIAFEGSTIAEPIAPIVLRMPTAADPALLPVEEA